MRRSQHKSIASADRQQDDGHYVRIDVDTYQALLADLKQHETLCYVLHEQFDWFLNVLPPDQFRDLLATSSSEALDVRCRLASSTLPDTKAGIA
ncbi:hypothetical protein ERD78_18695 [Allopusillimonas soli]|uniref:Uncharacterized protein n=1 Tax=Allopusillimonas soli TaxID=659016 RepID=A0A853FDF9_9BURK|nr:hypothetical protein [Allopusillimonas soli]NYT38904.1 hypothetical protein [Allopusillimonas soli]TEA70098.1 hypothetical protein ERD78_18695 [Allopusillimonas soli]